MSRSDTESSVHGTAVSRAGRGLLIVGAPGAGKSGLALRMMATGADLVADDRVLIRREGADLIMSAPPAIRGRIEARGVGILRCAAAKSARLSLVADLSRGPDARLPQAETISYHDVAVRLIFAAGVPNIEAILTILLQSDLSRDEWPAV